MNKKVKLEVGKEVTAYCSKCKDTTVHVVEIVKKESIAKVMCKACLSSHRYRTSADELPVKTGKKPVKKAPVKTAEEKKWHRMMAKTDIESPIEYTMQKSYKALNVIQHHTFGVGVVREVISTTKMSVVFQDGERTLVQNI